ncbi:MAG: glucoamylase family protein [Capsulimonadaceae bacterium]|nr:glucoamylase family protein [Capsulimonadaceae bacterium]
MQRRSTVLGIYRDADAARDALSRIRRHGFVRSTTITKQRFARFAPGRERIFIILALVAGLAAALPLGYLAALAMGMLIHSAPIIRGACVVFPLVAAVGVMLALIFVVGISKAEMQRHRPWIVGDETFLLVEIDPPHVEHVTDLLSETQRDRPVTFVFHPASPSSANDDWVALRSATPSLERLSGHARTIAETHVAGRKNGDVRSLSSRLEESEQVFELVVRHLATSTRSEISVDLSSEWLLDNAHLIRRHLEEYRSSLSSGFYRQLPILDAGADSGLPRVYAIARALIADTDAQFDKSKIVAFLSAYQSARPLTLGELWAMPLMLRLSLLEHLKRLILRLDKRQTERQEADFWANRLIMATRNQPESLMTYVAQLTQEIPTPSAHLVEQILGHLYDEATVVAAVRGWVETALNRSIADIIENEQRAQALQQVSLANAIGSLRDLSRTDWRTVVEETSVVDLILRTDPADLYEQMDFGTRDRYRHVIERIARSSKFSEIDVAWTALEIAKKCDTPLQQHVGYHLIDDGLPNLEKALNYHPPIGQSLRRLVYARPASVYIGAVAAFTCLVSAGLFRLVGLHADDPWPLALMTLPAILAASEIAVNIVNWLVAGLLPPRTIPRLDFSREIPDDCKTLVVVPMMLLTPESIRQEVERLNVHWLANQEKNLVFALLADYSDAPERQMPEDLERLEVARREIEALAEQHGECRFLLLHRNREWCESEGCWMGWERKRGKIEDLNRLLMNDPAPGRSPVIVHGLPECLEGIRYVITLDADTQLPKGTARRLVGAMAHPLNSPQLSADGKRVVRGYTIIQPRVSTSLPSATASLFSRLFTDPRGTDPYTHVVADLYQDLAGQASYYGKGIYDVAAFHRVLTGRFPESHLLSHDLLESNFVRAGLASDIELFDLFPADYISYSAREHRWIRGDWQIADWLLPRTPVHGGRERNPLNALSRWKIFDNLRRSLVPLAYLLVLLIGWTLCGKSIAWTAIVLVACILPDLLNFLRRPFSGGPQGASSRDMANAAARGAFAAALIPHQAFLAVDAITRVFYRRRFSGHKLLEWETAQEAHKRSKNRQGQFIISMLWIPLCSVFAATSCVAISEQTLLAASPFLALWASSPGIVALLWTVTLPHKPGAISEADRLFLRRVARRTWRFFDDFVSEETNWLPPDNFQASLRVETAPRTSLTNIGLWLLAAHAARDFGYATVDSLVSRLEKTFDTIDRLERPDGHLLNWYTTNDLTPCLPRYVSSVDSGNLLGSTWAFILGVEAFGQDALLSSRTFDGIADTAAVFRQAEAGSSKRLDESHTAAIDAICKEPGERLDSLVGRVRIMRIAANRLAAAADVAYADKAAIRYWAIKLKERAEEANILVDRYLGWVEILKDVPIDGLLSLGSSAHIWRRSALASIPSLAALSQSSVPGLAGLVGLAAHCDTGESRRPIDEWLYRLSHAVERSRLNAADEMARIERLADRARELAASIDMRFLFDDTKNVFAIGYNADEHRMDNSYYDLLASESRLGSLVAIANGDVPAKHWTALGRPFAVSYGRPVVLSWSGTMFEYLMPLLLTKCFENSLLELACRSAVACQIDYAKMRGVPWGISESGYSALDSRQIYQYFAFGVPGLGLKRDMDALLVVAPYATLLALMVNPAAAIANLRRLARGGVLRANEEQGMLGDCGFYEAIDYSRRTNAAGERGVIVRSYMAHHQGMGLVALDNILNDDAMRNRFHSDPRIRAVESLLYEGIHMSSSAVTALPAIEPVHRRRVTVLPPSAASINTPNTPSPRVALLSNSSYSVMVTNAGSGYSRWKDIELTRWRADATRDSYGTFSYIKDVETGYFWSTAHQPVKIDTSDYSVLFALEKAEIKTRCQGIESITEIAVSPEDDVEIRRTTLVNHTTRNRTIEFTSYAELSLAPHAADRAHPAFGKLFVETQFLPEYDTLAAHRRPRSSSEHNPWVFHLITAPARARAFIEYETDRAAFIGRGHDLSAPSAMDGSLKKSIGAVLDPIFSIRRRLTLKPGERVQLTAVLGVAEDESALARLAMKYSDRDVAKRGLDLAWTNAQLELRHLRIQSRDALRYQRLAGYVVYPGSALRPSAERLRQSIGGQERLWAHGISGDLPIVAITVGSESDLDVVRELLLAHSYWHVKSLVCDLVILNEEAGGYNQPLAGRLRQLVEIHSQTVGFERPGGVYIRPLREMGADDAALLQATARIVLVAARGSLGQQMGNIAPTRVISKPSIRTRTAQESLSVPLPFLELGYYNGMGGFSKDGREYAIYLGNGEATPAPWINVIANPEFGTIVSESGSGMTWAHNSQSNRLTPWNNDPVLDVPGDAIYLRDEDLGVLWTPTASPIRERDPYRARHGSGYSVFEHSSHGIMQELTVFVPVSDTSSPTVRVQILKLRNNSDRRRRLTLTAYAEWVLGTEREETQSHIQTLFDRQSQAIFARNASRRDYPHNVTFLAINRATSSYTCDRTEFLGRNGGPSHPEGLMRDRLSGTSGAGFDPCAALQAEVIIEPGRDETVIIVMGEAHGVDEARHLIATYHDAGDAAAALQTTRAWWDQTLSSLEVETPVEDANILINRWLLYQTISCRIWGRSAFYQSGGAYGFRDQLQDSMAVLYARPEIARAQILRSAARQFREGDVQHWWHVESGAGPRTRISDDLLWLPFVTAQYVRVTGDSAILDEPVTWLDGPILKEDEHEVFFAPAVTSDADTLLEHCRRAVSKGTTAGTHGLPLIGGGDWNDGFNRVGVEGKGESVWLAWFLTHVHHDMAELLRLRAAGTEAATHDAEAAKLAGVIEKEAWDGAWYRRAYFDDGTPLGSATSDEAQIDSLAQSWAVISGVADPARAVTAMASAEERLLREDWQLLLLFTPPFDKSAHDPGYIKGYVPGVRENGGQYTHGALWMPLAMARLGDGERAVKLLQTMNPVEHSRDRDCAARYAVEPYVVAADVYALSGREGRGGWTWYTGSSAWMYRVWVEEVLGLRVRGDELIVAPVIPPDWPGYTMHLRHGDALYSITVANPGGAGNQVASVMLDGKRVVGGVIRMSKMSGTLEVLITLKK